MRSLLSALVLVLLAAAPAQAATVFGSDMTGPPVAGNRPCTVGPPCTAFGSPAAPVAGVVTRVEVRAASAPGVDVRPEVVRPSGAGFASVALGPAGTVGAGTTTLPAQLPVAAGDRIGLRSVSGALPAAFAGTGTSFEAALAAGPATAAERPGELLVRAAIEPDADGDGFGDETQDVCPLDRDRNDKGCVADLALALNGPAFTVVGAETTYEVAVRNAGPSGAAAVHVELPLPENATVVRSAACRNVPAVDPPAPVGVPAGEHLSCDVGTVPAGATRSVTLVLAGRQEGATIKLQGTSFTSAEDPAAANNAAALQTRVTPPSVAPPRVPLANPACKATRRGTRDDDVLSGTAFGDVILGYAGRDLVRGGEGDDCIWGGEGNDVLDGDGGADLLYGGNGRDRLIGGVGSDRLVGGFKADRLSAGPGDDVLAPGPGRDTLSAGAGNDVISARDGARDLIDCGPGQDRVTADRVDRLRGCEQAARR